MAGWGTQMGVSPARRVSTGGHAAAAGQGAKGSTTACQSSGCTQGKCAAMGSARCQGGGRVSVSEKAPTVASHSRQAQSSQSRGSGAPGRADISRRRSDGVMPTTSGPNTRLETGSAVRLGGWSQSATTISWPCSGMRSSRSATMTCNGAEGAVPARSSTRTKPSGAKSTRASCKLPVRAGEAARYEALSSSGAQLGSKLGNAVLRPTSMLERNSAGSRLKGVIVTHRLGRPTSRT
ncbi:hypothetical protein D3C72_502090 [compost metagenome]